ncbi:MAG: prepilin-type N-terminal cleavage/methylation domain-containing protein [Planctomycetota bacterium]
MSRGSQRRAFTLVELMIIIGVLAILAAIVLPSLTNASSKASAATIASNMRSLADACRVTYEQTGAWPAFSTEDHGTTMPAALSGRMSAEGWADVIGAWGSDAEIVLWGTGNTLTFTVDASSDFREVLAELEEIVDDGSGATGNLTWTGDASGHQAQWVLAD